MSEKNLKLVAWTVAVLVLAYGGLTLARRMLGDGAPTGALEEAIGALDPSSLDSVLVEGPGGERVRLIRSAEGPWTVNGLAADFETVVRLRESMEGARAGSPVANNPANHERLGMTADSAWRASLHAGSGSVVFLLGHGGPSFGTDYARLEGSDDVYVLDGGFGGLLKRGPSEWRDRTIIEVDTSSVATVLLEREDETTSLVRSGATWESPEVEGVAPDSLALSSLMGQLAHLEASSFPNPENDAGGAEADGENEGEQLRRVTALDAQGDTLVHIELRSSDEVTWDVQVRGDSLGYRLSSFYANQLVPARIQILGGG